MKIDFFFSSPSGTFSLGLAISLPLVTGELKLPAFTFHLLESDPENISSTAQLEMIGAEVIIRILTSASLLYCYIFQRRD